jgi:hypothetical protein
MLITDNFESHNWHDNAIHGIQIEQNENGCDGSLILDIDYIAEWCSEENEAYSFKVAPADLIFHEVTDLVISIDYAIASAALQPMTIHEIQRNEYVYPNGQLAFSWVIQINWPSYSFIKFTSCGFTQKLRKKPKSTGAQYLSKVERS